VVVVEVFLLSYNAVLVGVHHSKGREETDIVFDEDDDVDVVVIGTG